MHVVFLKNNPKVLSLSVFMFEANDGPIIFVKYVLNAFAISCSSVNILSSTLNRHGFCFLHVFWMSNYFPCVFWIIFIFIKSLFVIDSFSVFYVAF